jgi:hypothetical protein
MLPLWIHLVCAVEPLERLAAEDHLSCACLLSARWLPDKRAAARFHRRHMSPYPPDCAPPLACS